MKNNKEIICFELNNWFCGRDYPPEEPFISWIKTRQFANDEWCKNNKLVVLAGMIDMSINYIVLAPKEWIIRNCPKLLSNQDYEYKTILGVYDKETEKFIEKEIIHKHNFSNFIIEPDEDNNYYGRFNTPCLDYYEKNFGVHWINEDE